MATAPSASLVDALRVHRLLEAAQLDVVKSLQARLSDPKALAGELIRRGWLTPYQANQLLQGKGQDLLLGSYVLLERLGEGGMGQVFKARNWKLGKIVALKLIRKERLDNPDAVRRFEREVRSAAALSHPNIVHAYDADQIGGTCLLVIEYVDGTDLLRLVKKDGPLPVERACEYIRQAALGLQHAFERGMVHRDIKPANLLLTVDGQTIKILDMGLARLDQPPLDDDKSSTMTQEGTVMGTPDYIAPEQALEAHTADIRADLYSLGCTFYFLLTGRVPFPGGTLLQKLDKHRYAEPAKVEDLRADVPPSVAEIVRKLMAKKPQDRYQTPAELPPALAGLGHLVSGLSQEMTRDTRTVAESSPAEAIGQTSGSEQDSVLANMVQDADTEALDSPMLLRRKTKDRRLLVYLVPSGLVALIALGVVLVLALKQPKTKKPPTRDDSLPVVARPSAKTKVDDAWIKQVAAMPGEKQVEAVAKKLQELNPGFDGKVTHKIENGAVIRFELFTDNVTDISPVRALKGLRWLDCPGSGVGQGKLADLSPLKGMELQWLQCGLTKVSDLSPLKGMALETLFFASTNVTDLAPLKGMPLRVLGFPFTKVKDLSPLKGIPLISLECYLTQISDLSPLKGMPLERLLCGQTQVSDLSPLKDMKLTDLHFGGTPVSDLSPLKGMSLPVLDIRQTKVAGLSPLKDMPLKELLFDYYERSREIEVLRSIKTLETINGKPAKEFWKEVDERKH